METIKKSHIKKWEQAIDAGVSQITSIQSNIEGLANVLGVRGMRESIDISFRHISEAASDLEAQLSLMEDEIEGAKSDPNSEIVRLDDGTFTVVTPGEN
jgi:hypothetical protein